MFEEILKNLAPYGAKLVAVSKTQSPEVIMEWYDRGQRLFGENRVQELVDKQGALPPDIEWHFIGHLQRNKVKYLSPFVSLIHSVDSLKLLQEINKQAQRQSRVINCLLQFHIAEEDTKFGLNLEEARTMLSAPATGALDYVSIRGIMGMATYTDDKVQIRREFRHLRSIFNTLKAEFFPGETSFSELSMGMSGDYLIALEEGSTIVRIGSLIFGERS